MVAHAAKGRNASSLLGSSSFRFSPLLVDHGKESLPERFLSMQASSRLTPYRLHSGFRELQGRRLAQAADVESIGCRDRTRGAYSRDLGRVENLSQECDVSIRCTLSQL